MAKISSRAPLVLGSASPRRRDILTSVGVPHIVVPAHADETLRPGEGVAAYLARVVLAKLAAVQAAMGPELAERAAAVLVADTTVVEGEISMGKPAGYEEALSMIQRLAGRTHQVHTRFAIALPASGSPTKPESCLHAETVVTLVTFRAMSETEARAYAASCEGMDKAGGYAVQGLASAFVSRIEGSYTNVVGLPACEVVLALDKLALR